MASQEERGLLGQFLGRAGQLRRGWLASKIHESQTLEHHPEGDAFSLCPGLNQPGGLGAQSCLNEHHFAPRGPASALTLPSTWLLWV